MPVKPDGKDRDFPNRLDAGLRECRRGRTVFRPYASVPTTPQPARRSRSRSDSLVLAACGSDDEAASEPAPVSAPVDEAAETESAASAEPVDEAGAAFAEVFSTTTALDGSTFDGAALAGTDAVVWFWAPWCTICRGEAPEVAEIAERYADQVSFVGVPGRGELDAMRAFVDDTGTGSLTHLADLDGSVWSAFGVYGQPAYAFIDDTGEIDVFVGGMGGDALAERVDELLAT
ncbi:MAG: redoxin family protein [Acidimicrobiia bacterium]